MQASAAVSSGLPLLPEDLLDEEEDEREELLEDFRFLLFFLLEDFRFFLLEELLADFRLLPTVSFIISF
jgi:hypothetical protein